MPDRLRIRPIGPAPDTGPSAAEIGDRLDKNRATADAVDVDLAGAVVEAVRAGWSYRQIARRRGGISHTTVRRIYLAYLAVD